MATKLTTRKPSFGNTRSHALNITKRKRKLNLVKKDGIVMSAREFRTLNKIDRNAKNEVIEEVAA